jgi:hypothetical protein
MCVSGGVLLSHAVPRAVPSALKSLASGFGMGPGVSPSPWPPERFTTYHTPAPVPVPGGVVSPGGGCGVRGWLPQNRIVNANITMKRVVKPSAY